MNTPLSFDAAPGPDGAPVLLVRGEVDRSNAAELAAALEQHLVDGVVLTVDLSRVDYLDSAGLSVLFAHAHEIEVLVPPLLAPVLAVSGLGELTTVRVGAAPPGRG